MGHYYDFAAAISQLKNSRRQPFDAGRFGYHTTPHRDIEITPDKNAGTCCLLVQNRQGIERIKTRHCLISL
jgi:hypothetical protein